jgi:general secretion pathway protein F
VTIGDRGAGLPRWRYRVASAGGAVRDGELEAATEAAALAALRRDGGWVVALTPVASGARRGLPSGGRGAPSLATATRSVATLTEAGVPVDRALATVAALAPGSRWCTAYGAMADRVRGGSSAADAAARVDALPRHFGPMLAAAEASGTLPATMALLAEQAEQAEALRQRLRGALAYPAVLAASTVTGVAVVLLVVVPRLAALVAESGAAVPWGTRLLLGVATALRLGGPWLLLAGGGLGVWGGRRLQTPVGRRTVARWARRLPVIGQVLRQLRAARYMGTLATALEAGVALVSAMALARAVADPEAGAPGGAGAAGDDEGLVRAEQAVRRGAGLAEALAPVLPPVATQLLAAGEGTGALPAMARRAARTLAADAEAALEQGVALLSPALVVGFGVVVGGVALALLQAIYGLNVAGP